MPGLPIKPISEDIDIDIDGNIKGLYWYIIFLKKHRLEY
jgi:hypothetical protein